MPTIPKATPPAVDDTVLQPPPDPDKTQLLARNDSTQLLDSDGEDIERRAPPGVNTLLASRFKLVQLVGEGGMSNVYKAIDLRRVEAGARDPYLAVKVLTARFDDYFSSLSVMHHEASKLQTLTHPNIVRVIDCDRDGQTVFMTMEFLDGTSLKFLMKKAGAQGVPREEALRMIASMVDALEFAHGKHIVHGDLKPSNVIVTSQGEVKVIDFGIARFLRKAHEDAPQDRMPEDYVAFTPVYASPEMQESAEPDPRDDVFALACIAHELLENTHPFNRTASATARAQGMSITPSKKLRTHEFRAIQSALNFDRAKRTPSARRFLEELTGVKRRSIRQTALAAALAVAALAGALLVGSLLVRTPDSATTPTEGQVFRDCATCPLMVVLKPGQFEQGSAAGSADALPFEQPAHGVNIAYPLAVGVSEVTVGEFAEFAQEHPRVADGCMVYDGEWRLHPTVGWRNAIPGQLSAHPVSCVSFQDATEYAAWLSRRTGAKYRLPSASEWEYLARAGATGVAWPDPGLACLSANAADASTSQEYPGWNVFPCNDGHVLSAPVGSLSPNAFGLADTLGNVFEWVQDCWREDYAGAPTDGSAVSSGDCSQREARGGSWFTAPQFVRAAYRNRFDADYHSNSLGFRVVREVPHAK